MPTFAPDTRMRPIRFPPATRRRRLAQGGALFLSFDALFIAVAVVWITQGRQIGLALALAALGILIAGLLAWVLARPPRAWLDGQRLWVRAGHRQLAVDLPAALPAASVVDLGEWSPQQLPRPLARKDRWRTEAALGWQQSADGRRWFCAVTRIGAAIQLPLEDGDHLLLTPEDPQALLQALRDAARPQPPRASSAATAGRVLPSRNSRKAPPPVEM